MIKDWHTIELFELPGDEDYDPETTPWEYDIHHEPYEGDDRLHIEAGWGGPICRVDSETEEMVTCTMVTENAGRVFTTRWRGLLLETDYQANPF